MRSEAMRLFKDLGALPELRADFWAGDPTKHFSVKKKGFSVKRGEGFSE